MIVVVIATPRMTITLIQLTNQLGVGLRIVHVEINVPCEE